MLRQNAALIGEDFRRAIDQHDIDLLLSLYADDAEIRVIDKDHPPSAPNWMQGREAIARYYRDVFARPMQHHIEEEVIGDDHLAFTEACEYQDGSRVFVSTVMELKNNLIYREVDVQAWDEKPTKSSSYSI